MGDKEEDAPIPAVRRATTEALESTLSGRSQPRRRMGQPAPKRPFAWSSPPQISRLKAKLGTWRDLLFSVISRQEADAWVPTATTL